MRSPASALCLLVLLAPALAGCLSPGEVPGATVPDEAAWRPGEGLKRDALTQPEFGALPKLVEYVPASFDGILLHGEVFLPDGDGPWPTILHLSPYNTINRGFALGGDIGLGLRDFFVPRGYAVVLVDVRGTGNSEGCMDMMGVKEQQDAHDVVQWIAEQAWSDGKVGMYGVSYDGTTPSLAAIMAPEALVTIVPIAGVTNQWRNMFMNGVPYQGRHYPATYAALVGAPPPLDVTRGPDWALNAANAWCDQEEAMQTYTPGHYEKGIYTPYWDERNLTAHANDVRASVFYVQGFTDRAVNPMEAIGWFNELEVPKKAFLGQWAHQLPPRDDWQDTLHAWFDHWLKGIDTGIMDTPTVEVFTNVDTVRLAHEWPPTDATRVALHLAPDALLDAPPADASQTYEASIARSAPLPTLADAPAAPGAPPKVLSYRTPALTDDLHMAGTATMHLAASVDAANTYFLLSLYDVSPQGEWREVTEGWMNAHLHEGFDRSSPLTPGETYRFDFLFEPREYVFEQGHSIGLRIHGHDARVFPVDEVRTLNTVHYGLDGSWLELPAVDRAVTFPRP